jgi:nucleotide-binding universal stress UspA family protein
MLAQTHEAALHVIHVAPSEIPAKVRAEYGREASSRLDRAIEQVRRRAGGDQASITVELLAGDAFVEVIRCSRNLGADLVVLGRHGHRGVRDLFLGTTVERVIRKGDTPVLVVNIEPSGGYRRPLIATDLRDTTPRLVELATVVAGESAKVLHLVHAYNVPFEGYVAPTNAARARSDYSAHFREEATKGLAKLVARYEHKGRQFRATARSGDPRSIILTEAVRSRTDLLVLGTHGRSGLAHALVGSVAEWVIAQTLCDVLVARPARFTFELP